MKKSLVMLLLVSLLGGCESLPYGSSVVKSAPVVNGSRAAGGYRLANSHWTDVAKIRDEATRLSYQVANNSITKAQAAQLLDKFRIARVGHNPVDDEMYAIYLRSAVESQQGNIDTAQSKRYIQDALNGWQQRWPNMQNKPANPAFTNFLMEVMHMKPLQ
ncbi:prokaryotic membrane lipolipid attachment site family protein [Neisseriaceae bacterium ESL0693]|nr:prokaryotic membrane lipolipid attachment site family protein [Neisseriaceae bacterium ESL0693]